jgi:hypothetical protein
VKDYARCAAVMGSRLGYTHMKSYFVVTEGKCQKITALCCARHVTPKNMDVWKYQIKEHEMEFKLKNGTIFTIEVNENSISVRKTQSNKETTDILTRQGCKFVLDDNLFYVI